MGKTTLDVSVADQGYPAVPRAEACLPTARDVRVAAAPARARGRATYRPRAREVAVDPRAPRPAGADFQVVGASGTVRDRLGQGPAPLGLPSPELSDVRVVPAANPRAPGLYPGPEAARDQRPAGGAREFCVVGSAGSLDSGDAAEMDVVVGTSPPVVDVRIVPQATAAVPGLYAGPCRAVVPSLRPDRVEVLPPTVDVKICDQVVGR